MDINTIRTNRWQEAVQQLLAVRRPQQAEQLVRRHLAAHPQDAAGYEQLALTLLDQPERASDAIEAILEAIGLDPQRSDAHYFYSVLLLRTSQTYGALQAINEALRLDAYCATYFGYQAVILNTRRQPEKALLAASAGLAINPDHLECLYQRILALRRLQRFREAAVEITQLAFHYPNHPVTHRLLGEKARRDRQPLVAETHFREALRLNSTDEAAQDQLLELLLDRGEHALAQRDYLEAKTCLREAVQLNSTLAVAQQLLQHAIRATLWWHKPSAWSSSWKAGMQSRWQSPLLKDKLLVVGKALIYCLLLPFLLAFYLFSALLDWRHQQQLIEPTPTDIWFFSGLIWGGLVLACALLPPWPPLVWLLVVGGLVFPLRNYWLRLQQGQKRFPLGVALLLSPGGNAILKAYSLLGATNAANDCRGFLAFFGVFLLLYQIFRPAGQRP